MYFEADGGPVEHRTESGATKHRLPKTLRVQEESSSLKEPITSQQSRVVSHPEANRGTAILRNRDTFFSHLQASCGSLERARVDNGARWLHLPVSTSPVRLATQCHCGERSHQQPVRFRAWDLREPLPDPSKHHGFRACQLVCGDFGARTLIKRAFGHCEWPPRDSLVWGSGRQTRQLDVA